MKLEMHTLLTTLQKEASDLTTDILYCYIAQDLAQWVCPTLATGCTSGLPAKVVYSTTTLIQ